MLKNIRYFTFITAALCILSTASLANDYIIAHVPQAQPVGKGRLSVMVWDVYDATLYAPQGSWGKSSPFALQLSYLRQLDGKKIADRSVEEMRKQGYSDEVKLAAWHAQMTDIFPDVHEGTTLTGVHTKEGKSIFYQDGVKIGEINDSEFSEAFFGIWLNEDTSAPALRKKLLGSA